jgi:ribonucleotide reductase alpha subunit
MTDNLESFFSKYAYDVFKQKYSLDGKETWGDMCDRVAFTVLNAVGIDKTDPLALEIRDAIYNKRFLPGGRYLRSTGREVANIKNCAGFLAEDSAEGWAELVYKVSLSLMHGLGCGVDYSNCREEGAPLKRKGGYASGPISLMQMVDQITMHVMAGGDRRGANLAQLSWRHPDIFKFISAKNWNKDVIEALEKDWNAYAPLKFTNISVRVGDKFIEALNQSDPQAMQVFDTVCRQMCMNGEPGFICNYGENTKEVVTNACQPGSAKLITPEGIRELKDLPVGSTIWSGKSWTHIIRKWSNGVKRVNRYVTSMGEFIGTEDHKVIVNGERVEVRDVKNIDTAQTIFDTEVTLDYQTVMDGIVLGDGSIHKASNNLIILYIGAKDHDYLDSEISEFIGRDRSKAFSNSEGTIVVEPKTTLTHKDLPKTYDRVIPDRFYKGDRNTVISFLRGLFTANGCVTAGRVNYKTSSEKLAFQIMDMLSFLGIRSNVASREPVTTKFRNGEYICRRSYSINLYRDSDKFMELIGFIQGYKCKAPIKVSTNGKYVGGLVTKTEYIGEEEVFDITVEADEHTYWTGGLLVSNCSEYRSEKDCATCNLVSVNWAAHDTLEDFKRSVELASIFAVAGNSYSYYALPEARIISREDNDIGIGIMGISEWFLKRGYKYGEGVEELHDWLQTWSKNLEMVKPWCNKVGVKLPRKGRAVAPTGSISILAETSGGIEPIFCAAYKRRVLKGGTTMMMEYLIDPVVKRLVESGISPDTVEDAYSIDYERRLAFQATVQDYCDMAISSTVNLPRWGSEGNNEKTVEEFKRCVRKYLPRLRGITAYPDGARGAGQPMTPVKYSTALKYGGKGLVEESIQVCDIRGGSCGT